jgi:Leucine-rich repeat (LRR) protein
MRCGKLRRGSVLVLLLVGGALLPPGCGDSAGPVYAPLAITTTSLPQAAPSVAYSAMLEAAGGDSSYTWSVVSGSLPPGLNLTASSGLILGTPVGLGSTFIVQVASGDGQIDTQQLTIDVYDVLSVTTMSLPAGATGFAYGEALTATGGDGSYIWSVTVGSLPTGLSLVDSTGIISGTPSAEGSDTFTVQVASGDGQTASQRLSIAVALVLQPSEHCSEYPDYAVASFEDANLEVAIRAALSVGAQEDLTCRLLAGLMALHDRRDRITSLVGIQNLTSLTNLELVGNSFSDLSALSGLTSLTSLSLEDNSISDISALSGLTSLSVLSLGHNLISDISALSRLTSLTSLYLSSNSISDISALNRLTSLTSLSLEDNSINDLSALSGLTSLSVLYLNGNSISDLGALSGLTSLSVLWLSANSISDLSPLSGLTSLSVLYLHLNSISDLGPLSGLTSLSVLYLDGNSISDLSPLSGLTSLSVLSLGNNSISDLSALTGLTSLKVLWLNANPTLTDIQPLLDNPGLGAGDEVHLESTNVSCTDVVALRAKGVTVEADCP